MGIAGGLKTRVMRGDKVEPLAARVELGLDRVERRLPALLADRAVDLDLMPRRSLAPASSLGFTSHEPGYGFTRLVARADPRTGGPTETG